MTERTRTIILSLLDKGYHGDDEAFEKVRAQLQQPPAHMQDRGEYARALLAAWDNKVTSCSSQNEQ